jgi:hypothetical protein
MYEKRLATLIIAVVCVSTPAIAAEWQQQRNLLRNPMLGFHAATPASKEGQWVTCWNTDKWGDISVATGSSKRLPAIEVPGNVVCIRPGKRFWQFAALPDLQLANGQLLSLAVKGYQEESKALQARLCLMLIESADGTWSPADYELRDQRTFARHGRGELVRSPMLETSSDDVAREILLKIEGLKIDAHFKADKESSSALRNIVGVLVEFANVSKQDVWIHSPTLVRGAAAAIDVRSSRPLPDYYRQIPRTLQKLASGQPLHILTLGSSIDRGSANPQLYLYNEDATSPRYKQPLSECRPSKPDDIARLLAEAVHRPDLRNYVGWWQHYFMYTGRMRLELMRKFNYPVNKILLNVMACDGSSIGESHSGFRQYAGLELPPDPNGNGNPPGSRWSDLYPALFRGGQAPAPDLVIFGHGHNEHIDQPDEIAAYEGAVRWFQRHYPSVEFVSCMWIRDKGSATSIWGPMQRMCLHYGIPMVDVGQMLIDLKGTCNSYALAVDGGHPGAAGHYLWCKQLEQVFEIPAEAQPGIPQRHLPARMNAYTYGWEGDSRRFQTPNPRCVDARMMIIEDCAFNVWANDKGQLMKLSIDGRPAGHAGHGRHSWSKPDLRNSTFVHGRLRLGDRHIIEVQGEHAELVAVDCKVCPKRAFVGAASDKWQGTRCVEPFDSAWGAPYGTQMFRLAEGASVEIAVTATDLSVAYLDRAQSGTLVAEMDGKPTWSQATNTPFHDSQGKEHFIENRRGITGRVYRQHRLRLRAQNGDVWILGLFTYDSRP